MGDGFSGINTSYVKHQDSVLFPILYSVTDGDQNSDTQYPKIFWPKISHFYSPVRDIYVLKITLEYTGLK